MTSTIYNNSYDIAAVMLCICCIFYFIMSKRIHHFKHTLYAALCVCVFSGSLSNILAGYFAKSKINLAANISISLYFLVNVLTMYVFGLYVQCLSGHLINRRKNFYLMYSIPAVIALLTSCITTIIAILIPTIIAPLIIWSFLSRLSILSLLF